MNGKDTHEVNSDYVEGIETTIEGVENTSKV